MKTEFDNSCKLSPLETICIKCQNLFSGEFKKNISKCLLKILPRVLSVNAHIASMILIIRSQIQDFARCAQGESLATVESIILYLS